MNTKLRGFTLTELAVALCIMALLLGGMLVPLSTQMDQKNYNDTRKLLGEAREALLGYAMTHTASDGKPRLPCPDTDNNGTENLNAAGCVSQEGSLPWSDLGLPAIDAWGNRLRYRVDAQFSGLTAGFQLSSTAALKVCSTTPCAPLATALPAILVSHGPNGAGAINQSGQINSLPNNADEQANIDNNDDFVMHTPVQNGFDDSVVWLSTPVLVSRMVSAGKLP